MSVESDEHVVRFDVAVDEAHLVNALDGEHELGDVEARHRLGEDAEADEHTHEVAAGHVVHYEVQVLAVLKRVVPTRTGTRRRRSRRFESIENSCWRSGIDELALSSPQIRRTRVLIRIHA